jgi:hypothetical protein
LSHDLHGSHQQITNHALDVSTYITHFGIFSGFDLNEGRVRHFCQAARDFGLAHAGGADHDNIFRMYLFTQSMFAQRQTALSVSERYGYSTFCVSLTDNEPVEMPYDLGRSEF